MGLPGNTIYDMLVRLYNENNNNDKKKKTNQLENHNKYIIIECVVFVIGRELLFLYGVPR